MINRIIKSTHGLGAIEFALVAPVFFLFLFAILEFSFIMITSGLMDSAAARASRLGLTGNTYTLAGELNQGCSGANCRVELIRQTIEERVSPIINANDIIIRATASDTVSAVSAAPNTAGCNGVCGNLGAAGQFVTYEVIYEWQYLTPFLSSVFGENKVLRSTMVVKNEDF